jgi:hypothetical protein
VQGASTRVNTETYPLGSMVTYYFGPRPAAPQAINQHVAGLSGKAAGQGKMPACKLVWYDGGLRPPRPEALPEGIKMGDNGRLLVGDRGFILNGSVFPQGLAKKAARIPQTIQPSTGHYEEFANACKGGPRPGANFDWAGPLAEAVLLGNVALRVQLREELTIAKLFWDPVNLRVTNLEEANQYVKRSYREGWVL